MGHIVHSFAKYYIKWIIIYSNSEFLSTLSKEMASIDMSCNTHIRYHINISTKAGTWTIKRRFNEFEQFHKSIIAILPNIKLPPFPDKGLTPNFNTKHILERSTIFESNTATRLFKHHRNLCAISWLPVYHQISINRLSTNH